MSHLLETLFCKTRETHILFSSPPDSPHTSACQHRASLPNFLLLQAWKPAASDRFLHVFLRTWIEAPPETGPPPPPPLAHTLWGSEIILGTETLSKYLRDEWINKLINFGCTFYSPVTLIRSHLVWNLESYCLYRLNPRSVAIPWTVSNNYLVRKK